MITLTREEAEHVLKLLDKFDTFNDFTDVRQPLRAKLSEPPCKTGSSCTNKCERCGEVNPAEIHTCTPQREWQGLTDEEIEQIVDQYWEDLSMFAEAIEAKLKEKNA